MDLTKPQSMLSLTAIQKHYHQGEESIHALKKINLDIPRGKFIALSGPSGSGKSTLLNICGLLDQQYQGSYELDGKKMTNNAKLCTQVRREKLGFVFQHFNLVPVLTAYENVEYPLILNRYSSTDRKIKVTEILEKIGIKEHQHRRPDRLSGGQQQRVAIARALVNSPLLVIADEPTANLDTRTANQVIDLMQTLGREQNTTFLIATHDDRMSSRCDQIIELQDGLLVSPITNATPRGFTPQTTSSNASTELRL